MISDLPGWTTNSVNSVLQGTRRLFFNEEELTNLVIPAGVTRIGERAFQGCSGLMSVSLPDSVTSIGADAFSECSDNLFDTNSIPGVVLVDGWAVGYTSSLSGELDLTGVRGIGNSAFRECYGLTSVTLPDGMANIGASAFYDCRNLMSVQFPDGLETIGESAFRMCRSLASITIPDSVTCIADGAFASCSELTSIMVPRGVTDIGESAFSSCSKLTSIAVDENNAVFDSRNNCQAIVRSSDNSLVAGCKNTVIPNSVTRIGNSAFSGCSQLVSIAIPNSVTNIGDGAFSSCSRLASITIPNSVTHIGNGAFWYCYGLSTVAIPSGVTRIGDNTFYCCDGFTSITIPDNVTSIGYSAFWHCSKLKSITIPGSVTNIEDSAFASCSGLEEVTFLEGVTSIGWWTFSGCTSLESIKIPSSVTRITNKTFEGCDSVKEIVVPGHLLLSLSDLLPSCYKTITNAIISQGSTYVNDGLFRYCSELMSVTIPDGVTNIGRSAFYGCSKLASAAIPDSVVAIGDSAFRNCSSLRSTMIPQDVTDIGRYAFYDCSSLTAITIPDGVTNIGSYAFSGCSGLMSISIPSSVARIENGTFSGCSGLTSGTISDGVTSIGNYAFSSCTGLTSVTIPFSITNIEGYAFSRCSGLETLYLPRTYHGVLPTVPSGCTIVRYDAAVLLSVSSPVGEPMPGGPSIPCVSNVVVSCSVTSPFERHGLQYVCTGWRGTGSVPASGTGTAVDVLMKEPSSIAWLWETNVWISLESTGDATVSGTGTGWFRKDGAAAVFTFVPSGRPCAFSLAGDTDGVVVDTEAGTISIPADRPRSVGFHVPTHREAGESDGKPLVWSDDAEKPWFAVADESAPDGFSLRSGAVRQGGTNILETTVTGPGTLSFAWRIDANDGDSARFDVDETKRAELSAGPTAWETNELVVASGDHRLRWTFERGSAAGGAVFLDAVRWIPRHALSVSSENGTPAPAVGMHELDWGTESEASVATPEQTDGVRIVCTGWTGTGSVPEDGTGTNVSFRIEEDSSITWNWRTDYWIDVAVTSGGTTSFQPKWVAAGKTRTVSLSPDWTLFDIVLSGDTEGVTVSDSKLSVPADRPRTIRVAITERKLDLAVDSEFGDPSPTNGVHSLSWGTDVEANVTTPDPADGFQYICTGWTGTGSVPASGDGTNVSFRIEEDSSIRWNWRTNVWIALGASGPVSTTFLEAWTNVGETIVVGWTPTIQYFTVAISGDTDGVMLDEEAYTLSIPADKPRIVLLVVEMPPLVIETASLPDAQLYSSYNHGGLQMSASGGTPPYQWSANGLPDGLHLTEEGELWGFPQEYGEFDIEFSVCDSLGNSVSSNLVCTVNLPPLRIQTWSVPIADAGQPYSTRCLSANGGLPPYVWSVSGLPAGLSASADGRVSGTTEMVGTHDISVVVEDSLGHSASCELELSVCDPDDKKVIYVDASSTATDPNGRSWATAYTDLQTAAQTLSNGRNLILVAPGQYTISSQTLGLDGNTELVSTGGATRTIIDMNWSYDCGIDEFRRIDGFTICNCCYVAPWDPDAIVENCIVTNCDWDSSSVLFPCVLRNCLVFGNWSNSSYDAFVGGARIENCTFFGNAAVIAADCVFVNSIVWNCVDWEGNPTGPQNSFTNCTFTNCLVQGWNADMEGSGSFDADPLFVDPAAGDFRLQSGSPCIDAGLAGIAVWTNDLAGLARVSGRAVDLGAYEFQFAASETRTTPVPVPFEWMDAFSAMLANHGGDYETFGNATASNGVNKVWECFVTGLDPTSATNRFLAEIVFDETGSPEVKWSPDLGDERRYSVLGKTNLVDESWGPTNEATRFFRVKVSMP